jgi:hypothetical protein
MKPIKFDYANATFTKNDPNYMPLPAWTDGIQVVSGWSLSWRERCQVFRTGVLWIRQQTFGRPLQPLRPQALNPFPKMPMVPNDNVDVPRPAAGLPVIEPAPSKLEPMDE